MAQLTLPANFGQPQPQENTDVATNQNAGAGAPKKEPEGEKDNGQGLDPGTHAAPETDVLQKHEVPLTDAELAAKKLETGKPGVFFNPSLRNLRDPHTGDRFPAGQTVRVKEIGSWTILQVAANVLRVGKADDLGAAPEDNSDFVSEQEKRDAEEAKRKARG